MISDVIFSIEFSIVVFNFFFVSIVWNSLLCILKVMTTIYLHFDALLPTQSEETSPSKYFFSLFKWLINDENLKTFFFHWDPVEKNLLPAKYNLSIRHQSIPPSTWNQSIKCSLMHVKIKLDSLRSPMMSVKLLFHQKKDLDYYKICYDHAMCEQ